MFSEVQLLILDLLKESTIGKLLQIKEHKINSKLESLQIKILISTVPSVIIHLALPTMVLDNLGIILMPVVLPMARDSKKKVSLDVA